MGGILCDDTGKPLRFFSERVPKLMLQALMEEAQNLIYLIELLAAYLAVFLWGGLHSSRYVVAYINSSTKLGNAMVRMFVNLEDNSQWKIWFGRFGSHSNPSDDPSRLHVEDILKRGAVQDSVAWDVVLMAFEDTLHELGRG